MIENKPTQPETEDKRARRRGGFFDSLAHVLRDVREIVFKNGFLIKNRPGLGKEASGTTGFVPVKNMVEFANITPPEGKLNAIVVGRSGDGENRNTNLIELSATAQPEHQNLELGYSNGVVKLRAVRAGENPPVDRAGVTVGDVMGFQTGNLAHGVIVHVAGHGEDGGVVLSHITNRADNPSSGATGGRRIMILDYCIRITGLPTSSSGLPSGALWRDGTTLRIVA